MSGVYIQWHITGNIFLFNVYKRFLYSCHVFTVFQRFHNYF